MSEAPKKPKSRVGLIVLLLILGLGCWLLWSTIQTALRDAGGSGSTTGGSTSSARSQVDIVEFSCSHDSIGNMIITGTIQNTGTQMLRFVQLRGTAVTADLQTVNTHTSYAASDRIEPGAQSTFTVYVDDPGNRATKCRIAVEDADFGN